MSEYMPTEYVVDFGDYRSNRFVELSMALIEQNSAKLEERIVRCRDCEHWYEGVCYRLSRLYDPSMSGTDIAVDGLFEVKPEGYCAWAERREQ